MGAMEKLDALRKKLAQEALEAALARALAWDELVALEKLEDELVALEAALARALEKMALEAAEDELVAQEAALARVLDELVNKTTEIIAHEKGEA